MQVKAKGLGCTIFLEMPNTEGTNQNRNTTQSNEDTAEFKLNSSQRNYQGDILVFYKKTTRGIFYFPPRLLHINLKTVQEKIRALQ